MKSPDPLHDEILTVEDVAELLQIHENSVYSKVEKGELPGVFRLGDHERSPIRFSKRLIMEWIAKQAHSPE